VQQKCDFVGVALSPRRSGRHPRAMAPPRIQLAGASYHLNGKAVDGTKLFRDDSDRLLFLRLLAIEARRSDWCVLAYTLMTTHYHLVIELRQPTLSSGFQRLNSVYARAYNRVHDRRGALWQRRYFDALLESENHLYEAIRYVALNAPRAGMCPSPEDWPWSSYGAAVGLHATDPIVDEHALLRLFGTRPDAARKALRAIVEEADPRVRRSQTPVRLGG
jgi:putative transposase